MKTKKELLVRVNYAVLLICYLEVVLWTTCLLAASAGPLPGPGTDSHSYLLRETGNLKFAGKDWLARAGEHGFKAQLKEAESATRDEHIRWRSLLSSVCCEALDTSHAGLTPLRSLPADTGAPAPYTSILAIT